MPEPSPYIKTSVELPRDQHAALVALAQAQGRPSLNSLVRQAIAEFLQKRRK